MRNMWWVETTTDKPDTFYQHFFTEFFSFCFISEKKYWVQPSSIDLFFEFCKSYWRSLCFELRASFYITQLYVQSLEWWYFQSPLQSFLQLLVAPLGVFCNKVALINSRFSAWHLNSWIISFPIWKIGFNECASFEELSFFPLQFHEKLSFL